MTLTGTLTQTTLLAGDATVIRAQYDNTRNIIQFSVSVANSTGRPATILPVQTITGADATALGAAWADADLLNWFAKQNGLVVS